MEIIFKLDTNKAARATVAITASYSYGLGWVSELAFANAIALIIIIAILYSTRPVVAKKTTPQYLSSNFLQFARTFGTLLVHE